MTDSDRSPEEGASLSPTLRRRATVGSLVVVAVGLGYSLGSWPVEAVIALFGIGGILAFLSEAVVVSLGWLEHRLRPRVFGVPLVVIPAWPATVSLCLGIAVLVVPAGWQAALLASVLAMLYDLAVAEPVGLTTGLWIYPDSRFSRLRLGDVPWWNIAGWLALSFVLALIPWVVTAPG